MTRASRSGMALAACITVAPLAPAAAQTVTLTEGSGRPLIVGDANSLGEGLVPTALAPEAAAAEFRRICLPDSAGASARVAGSPLALESADAMFASDGKSPETRVPQWRGPSASLSIWAGDDAGLKKRQITISSRAYATSGGYGSFRASGIQCNLVVMLPDFAAATALSSALTAALGAPGKLVIKKTFADGHWQLADTSPAVRINFTAPTTRTGPQPVHLSAQLLEKDSKR